MEKQREEWREGGMEGLMARWRNGGMEEGMEEELEGWHDGDKVEAKLERRVGSGAVNPPW